MVVNKAKKAGAVSAGFCCYIGPNITGVIQTGTIYPACKSDALKLPELELAISKQPGIADLVVDGATLGEDRAKTKIPGQPLYRAYKKLLQK